MKQLSKIQLNINKDKGEILLSTSYEDLHKHGYKPYIRWGSLNETLAASCILESGVLDRARHTGKLYLWDPFCGSGSFLIETLMMALNQPVRSLDETFPFEHWPVHKAEEYERFKSDLEQLRKVKSDLDIRLIGSDISIRAIEAASNNLDFANINKFADEGLVDVRTH